MLNHPDPPNVGEIYKFSSGLWEVMGIESDTGYIRVKSPNGQIITHHAQRFSNAWVLCKEGKMKKPKPNPKFPIGTIVKARFYKENMVVVEWEIFYEKFHKEIEENFKSYSEYIPVREPNGSINGFYPDTLTIVDKGTLSPEEIGHTESVRGTIEI